jgi:hypothetical protein
MPKPGPRTTYRYSEGFKAGADRFGLAPGVAVGDAARSLHIPQQRAFANCAAARAAGAAPVRRGDPGDGPHLDRNNDGVGCE